MTTLYIAEKPSLGKAIAGRLGVLNTKNGYIECKNDTIVTWCFGHLYEQYAPDDYTDDWKAWSLDTLPMVPTQWKLQAKKEASAQLKTIKGLLKEARVVVNAGDPDDEGTLLVWEVLEQMNFKGEVRRIWLAALDNDSIDKAIATIKPAAETYGMKEAAECRSRADWLIGMNLTRAFTINAKDSGHQGVLSIGRVQTPTLALVVNRDLEIDGFKSKEYFEVQAEIGGALATWEMPETTEGLDSEGRLCNKQVATAAEMRVRGQNAVVDHYEEKEVRSQAPLPYSLSALQAKCSSKFGYSAQKVLDIAQSLYEKHKLTTYPRTDCQYLPESMHAEAGKVLSQIGKAYPALFNAAKAADATKKHKAFNDKKVTAHHAIIPTLTSPSSSASLTAEELNVYTLICEAYLALFYPEAVSAQATVIFDVAGEKYKATGSRLIHAGFKVLTGKEDEDSDEEPDLKVPAFTKGARHKVANSRILAKNTTPPARFTEGTLIKAMSNIASFVSKPEVKKLLKESAGIGTEATRAGILELLKKRGFLIVKGKQLISSPAARSLIKLLPEVLTTPDLTAVFEQKLSSIRTGEQNPEEFLAKQVEFVKRLVGQASTTKVEIAADPSLVCPDCGKGHLRRINGKNGYFWGCSNFKEGCKTILPDSRGKPGKKESAGSKPRKFTKRK